MNRALEIIRSIPPEDFCLSVIAAVAFFSIACSAAAVML